VLLPEEVESSYGARNERGELPRSGIEG
jgi:hypothetical protein